MPGDDRSLAVMASLNRLCRECEARYCVAIPALVSYGQRTARSRSSNPMLETKPATGTHRGQTNTCRGAAGFAGLDADQCDIDDRKNYEGETGRQVSEPRQRDRKCQQQNGADADRGGKQRRASLGVQMRQNLG